ncbi:MAG TPA: hypothetical protein VL418_04265 [Devosiaceae bacterium]|nr:hypothetical protein [Devosiaceae bacterium]
METYDPHKSTVEVRQGDRHQMNKRALIISMIVVIIAFALIYLWFSFYDGSNGINRGY